VNTHGRRACSLSFQNLNMIETQRTCFCVHFMSANKMTVTIVGASRMNSAALSRFIQLQA
jgi:hypothetical protein